VIKRGTAHPFLGNDYIRPSAQALGAPVDLIGVHMPSVVAAALPSRGDRRPSGRRFLARSPPGARPDALGLARGALGWAGRGVRIFEIDFISILEVCC
jgi:hypothetical protein